MNLKCLILLLFACLYFNPAQSQKLTTAGKEFFVTFLNHPKVIDTAKTQLFLTAIQNTTGSINNPNTGYTIPFSIAGGTVTQITIPLAQALNVTPGAAQNKGLIVTASDTISLFALNSQKHTSDATNVLQKDALGTKYLVASYNGLQINIAKYFSSFVILATEDNTSISITPSAATFNGDAAGIPFNILLNKGQTYLVKALANLSGSLVSVNNDCKKIAVFSGADENFIPFSIPTASADHLYEQLFPVSSFGKQFITTPLKGRNLYIARIYAAYDNTAIAIDGTNVSTINAGQFYDVETLNQSLYITTYMPSQVMLFAPSQEYDRLFGPVNLGDPSMITIPPVEQQLTESIFLSPVTGVISDHKVNILCKTADAPFTLLDGINVGGSFNVIPGNALYSFIALEISAGQHRIKNPNGFIAYAYGFGKAQGYGYCTGSSVEKINAYFKCNGITSIGSPTIDVCTGPAVFDIITSEPNAAYTWDFGDGSAPVTTDGTVLQQTHNYPADGNYIVKLTTTSSVGNACEISTTNATQLTLHVVSSLSPSVNLTTSPQGPVCRGVPVSFVATATNAGATPFFQWKLNGANVGTNSPIYTDSTLNDADVISCMVTGSLSCTGSSTATGNVTAQITASVKPAISISTDSTSVCGSSPATFKAIVAAGLPSPFYQWKVNRVNMGTNTDSFTYTPKNNDSITCELTVTGTCFNPPNVTSNVIVMSVQNAVISPAVSITTAQTTVCAGTNISFTAVPVNGGTTATYQWKLNGANTGTSNAVFSSSILKNNDTVRCILTSSQGCLTTQTAVSNNIIMLVNPVLTPSVSIAASAVSICQGVSLTITATPVTGGAAPVYQWKLNGNDVVNNGPVFTSANFNNNDIVSCIMTGNATCTLNPAISNVITVKVDPTITTSVNITASDNRICKGEEVIFTAASLNGGNAPVYKWYLNGSVLKNGTNTCTSSLLSDGDKVSCEMISSLGCTDTTNSQEIIMQVDPLPTVVFNPAEIQILYGSSVQLAPAITGDIANYLWTPSDNLSTTSSATTIANPLENKQYKLAVTSVDGCKANALVTVKVFRDLLMPTAFTPDGNGINDLFRIPPGINLSIGYLIVYNRFGEKVFETADVTKGWDGTFNGSKLPSGAFTWMIQYKNPFNNELVSKKGTVVLIR